MKKKIRTLVCTVLVISLLLPGTPVFAASVQVTLPAFSVTLNDKLIENAGRKYPLIVYRDITYFPMTFYDCHYLGLETYYTNETGLEINKKNRDIVPWSYRDYESSGSNPRTATAQIAKFPIRVNGKTIDNSKEEYPLLLYKDITYFPLTWRYAVDEFGWDYRFDEAGGLFINSFSYEDLAKLLSDIYGDDIQDIIGVISDNIKTSEWVSYSFRAYSRHEDRLTGILREHRLNGTKWYYSTDGKSWRAISETDFNFPEIPDLTGLLSQLSEKMYGEGMWTFFDGYPCLIIGFMDETPSYMPKASDDGASISSGGINRHEFFIDLNEGCLRSYQVSTSPFFLGENGEIEIFAPPTTIYSVIDLDYSPFIIP